MARQRNILPLFGGIDIKGFMIKLSFLLALLFFNLDVFAENSFDCGNNQKAIELVKLIQNDKKQKRPTIRCNKLLTKAAQAKAKNMASAGLVVHNLGGSPNSHLESAGYKLPEHYGREFNSNQVEAIAGGYASAESLWQSFKDSKGHRSHLLGEHEFYLEQDEIGVAFIKNSSAPHVEYWVVYLAKGFKKNQTYKGNKDKIPNKALSILENSN